MENVRKWGTQFEYICKEKPKHDILGDKEETPVALLKDLRKMMRDDFSKN